MDKQEINDNNKDIREKCIHSINELIQNTKKNSVYRFYFYKKTAAIEYVLTLKKKSDLE